MNPGWKPLVLGPLFAVLGHDLLPDASQESEKVGLGYIAILYMLTIFVDSATVYLRPTESPDNALQSRVKSV